MYSLKNNSKTPNEIYVKRYEALLRLIKISRMLSQAKITINQNNK